MKLLSEYLEHALTFERLAAQESDPAVKSQFEKQAVAYRKTCRRTRSETWTAPSKSAGESVVTDEKQLVPKQQAQDRTPCCPTCAAFPRLMSAFLDPRRGKSVRLYECEKCGQRIWDD